MIHSIYDLWGRDLELFLGWFEINGEAFIYYSKNDFWLIRITLNSNSLQLKKVSVSLFLLLEKCWSFDDLPSFFAISDLDFA